MCCCPYWLGCLFRAHMRGGSSPFSCGVFFLLPLSQAFLFLVAGCAPPLPLSLTRPGLFIYNSGRDFPSPPFGTQGTPLSLLRVFIVLIDYYSVSLFSLGGGWSVHWAMLIWPRVVCGSTTVPLSSPCGLHLPKPSGCRRLAVAWGPSLFLDLM
jgi:hypothetical protein